jgi:sugar phosphate isomerase/epimerase
MAAGEQAAVRTMLFSVSYAGLWGQATLDLEAFIDKAAELGYDAVELMAKRPHLSPLDWTTRRLRALRRRAEAAGVEIGTLGAYTDFSAGYAHSEIPQVELQIAHVERLAEMAGELGAGVVRVFTGYATDRAGWHAQRQTCIDAIRECGDRCAKHNVIVGVQNHHDIAVGVEDYVSLMAEVGHKNVRALFDAWSISKQDDVNLEDAARRLAPTMVQTTTADYDQFPQYRYEETLLNYRRGLDAYRAVPMGQGCIDYTAFFCGLVAGGFEGAVCYEMCSPLRGGGSLENLDATAAASLEFIRSKF